MAPPQSHPPFVVSLERAWHDLMVTLAQRNAGKAAAGQIIRRTIRSQQGSR